MSNLAMVRDTLHRSFNDAIAVRPVPAGLAVSSPFFDGSGDRISFYVREGDEGLTLEDDGDYLPHLIASGIDIEVGQRRQLLDSLLAESGAYWDTDTFEIRSQVIPASKLGAASVKFLSALLRIRTLEALSKETIRSTFKEDATDAIERALSSTFQVTQRQPLDPDLSEFPADIVLASRDEGAKKIGLFLVNSPTQFLEADILRSEIDRSGKDRLFQSVALIEDLKKVQIIGERRYQRAINRGLQARFFRDDEVQAIESLRKLLVA